MDRRVRNPARKRKVSRRLPSVTAMEIYVIVFRGRISPFWEEQRIY